MKFIHAVTMFEKDFRGQGEIHPWGILFIENDEGVTVCIPWHELCTVFYANSEKKVAPSTLQEIGKEQQKNNLVEYVKNHPEITCPKIA